MAWGGSSSGHSLSLKGVYNGDVEGRVLSPNPVGDQYIGWLPVVAKVEVLTLLDWVEDSTVGYAW